MEEKTCQMTSIPTIIAITKIATSGAISHKFDVLEVPRTSAKTFVENDSLSIESE